MFLLMHLNIFCFYNLLIIIINLQNVFHKIMIFHYHHVHQKHKINDFLMINSSSLYVHLLNLFSNLTLMIIRFQSFIIFNNLYVFRFLVLVNIIPLYISIFFHNFYKLFLNHIFIFFE